MQAIYFSIRAQKYPTSNLFLLININTNKLVGNSFILKSSFFTLKFEYLYYVINDWLIRNECSGFKCFTEQP